MGRSFLIIRLLVRCETGQIWFGRHLDANSKLDVEKKLKNTKKE